MYASMFLFDHIILKFLAYFNRVISGEKGQVLTTKKIE